MMESNKTEPSASAEPYQCTSCGNALPIEICTDREDAVSLACAFCGARYRGFVVEPGPEARAENVLVLEPRDT